jgi:localization factor PodJL
MDSQYNLGVLCARGFGVEQNSAEAYKWFTLAALQGDRESARKRDDIASRLDAQSLMAAKLAAKTWVAQPQPAEATTVKVPTGGWDRTLITPTVKRVSAPPAKHKLRARTPLHIGPG